MAMSRLAGAAIALALGSAAPTRAAAAEAPAWRFGGSDGDEALAVAVDATGSTYVTGRTVSADFPGAAGAVRGSDVFVTKLDDSGLVYSTVIGGADADEGLGIAVDGAGRAYVVGQTWSADFPGGPGGGSGDAFVARLSPDGSTLEHSIVLGGGARDAGLGIALRGDAAYITGYTASPDFPATEGAFAGTVDAFAAELAPDLVRATLIGGSGADAGFGIAVDRRGAAYLTGRTASPDFPAGAGGFGGVTDAFVTKLAPGGPGYSTLLGGAALDAGTAVAVDRDGTAYVTGVTYSADYPATPGAARYGGDADAFVTALRPDGRTRYSTFLGGSGRDEGAGIAVYRRSAHVAGQTWSADFPASGGLQGAADAFAAELTCRGAVGSATLIGGSDYDAATAIAAGPAGVAVAGGTLSGDFPAPLRGPGGRRDAFVTTLHTYVTDDR